MEFCRGCGEVVVLADGAVVKECPKCPKPGEKLTRKQTAYRESTRDPIFLFQSRRWIMTGEPVAYDWDGEHWVPEGHPEGEPLTMQELGDMECAMDTWDTDGVFLSREEGNTYGERHHYRWPDGWRVYCVCAEGELAKLLLALDDK